MSVTAWAFLPPPGGMLPPNQLSGELLVTIRELVPLMYEPRYEYAPLAEPMPEWQCWQSAEELLPR